MKINDLEGFRKTFLVLTLLSIALFSLPITSALITDDLLHAWGLEDVNANFSSKNLVNNNGVTFTTGKNFNGALLGAGNTNKYLSNASPSVGIYGGPVSVSAWINATGVPTAGAPDTSIISFGDGTSRVSYLLNYEYVSANNYALGFHRLRNGVADNSATYPINLTLNTTWYNVIGTYDGTNVRIWVGDTFRALSASAGNGSAGGQSDLRIGDNVQSTGRTFKGMIDEVYIWGRNLTRTEITTLSTTYYPLTSTSISINAPTNNSNFAVSQAVVFNWTSTSSNNFTNTTLFINNGFNETINITGISNITTTTKYFSTPGQYTFITQSCISSSCTNSTTYFFNISSIVLNSQSYTTPISEGVNNLFTANISSNSTALDTVYLNYSGTTYLASVTSSAGYFIATRNITSPLVSGSTVYPFNFIITNNEGKTLNTTLTNQTVTDILIGNCTAYNITLFNFTMYDERTQALINATALNSYAQATFSLYLNDYSSLLQTYSTSFNRTNPFTVCLSNTIGTDRYYIDGEVQYTADTYVKEFYNLLKSEINSTTLNTNISLYLLNSSYSQLFKVYYKDSSFLPVANALVQVQRKFLLNGSFITVEQPQTDDDGQTLVHLELNDVVYNFVIVKDGEVISTFENRLAYCPNPTFTDCEIFLNEYSSNSEVTDFTTISGLSFDLDFNRTTRDITLLFSVLSGSPATVLLNVTLNDNFGNTTICTDSVTSSSGTITCNIPAGFGNTSVVADIYYNGRSIGQTVININVDPSLIYVGSRVLIGLIMVLSVVGISLVGIPIITGFFLIISLILLVTLNIVASTGIIGASATILWFIIAVILVIFKGGNR